MKVVFVKSEAESSNIRTFYFRPEKTVEYTAGQFAEWTLPHLKPDNRGISRWFTISSSPTDELVSITTKFADKNSSSFKKALLKLKPGDEIDMSEAMGDFVLPKLIQTPLIFIAGGIGITPFHSILKWLESTSEKRPIKIIYGVNSEEEIIFQSTFDATEQPVNIVVGDIRTDHILGFGKPTEDTLIYVAGPEPMVEKLENELYAMGIKSRQFVGDFFPNYPHL